MAHRPVATIDRARIAELTAREQERLDDRHPWLGRCTSAHVRR